MCGVSALTKPEYVWYLGLLLVLSCASRGTKYISVASRPTTGALVCVVSRLTTGALRCSPVRGVVLLVP